MPRSPCPNVKRRGAAYWWRRTISLAGLALPAKNYISLEFSLFTKELDLARGRAAAMTTYSERLKMSLRENVALNGLDEASISALFVEEVRNYRNELVHLEAAWKAHPVWSRVSDRQTDLKVFENLWSGIAAQGLGVPRDWDFVERHFGEFDLEMQSRIRSLLRDNQDLPDTLRSDARRRLEGLGADVNAVTIPVAVDIVARARAEAARRVRENTDFADLANLASLARAVASAWTGSAPASAPPAPAAALLPAAAATDLTDEQRSYLAMRPTEFVEVFIKTKFGKLDHRTGSKRQKQIVGDSTFRDVRWACQLLEKALPEGTPFSQVTQNQFRNLDSWFDRLPISVGKSPRDREPQMTLENIAERAVHRVAEGDLDACDIGLSSATTNKHWANLARIHGALRSLVPIVPALSVSDYITPDLKSAREARDQLSEEQGRAIFRLPPWSGCAGLQDRLAAGGELFHDGLYFVLLLVWYTGARREEICKLMIEDIFTQEQVPHIYIRRTETGRTKTENARRKIPIHSELLRLGFLSYVEAMRAEGENLLFAELYPAPGTKRAIGDVFYKLWWIYLRPHIPDLKRGQAMHAARHKVSDALKQAGISVEERNDMLGQSQKALGEGADRYSEPVALARMKEMVELIPNVTDHLLDCDQVNLLPKDHRVQRPSRGRGE